MVLTSVTLHHCMFQINVSSAKILKRITMKILWYNSLKQYKTIGTHKQIHRSTLAANAFFNVKVFVYTSFSNVFNF